MLVLVSDLHFTDGSTGPTLSSGALSLFAERLQEAALAASWRTDGRYRPIDEIHLVLLGDIVDVMHSAGWQSAQGVRPWGNVQSPQFIDLVTQITAEVLRYNAQALDVLRGLAGAAPITIPAANSTGRPSENAAMRSVPVKTHYMVGNHDWIFHLPGAKYDSLRQMVVRQMGLANAPEQPFAHDTAECEALEALMRRHKVTARHGDVYDPWSLDGDRDASSLGDAIVIELLCRFGAEVSGRLREELPAATVVGLLELDNVRPLALVSAWLEGLVERTCRNPSTRNRVKAVWNQLVDELLAIEFVRRRRSAGPGEQVDVLERTLKLGKRPAAGWRDPVGAKRNCRCGESGSDLGRHALSEPDFRNRRARHVVYGHSHRFESVPLDASFAEGYVLNQTYFNAGTWRRIHRPTQGAPGGCEFIASDAMSYLIFFHADERKGRPYETWSGSLGFHAPEATIHRIDPGRHRHASGQPISTSGLHQQAPHFAALPARAGMPAGHRNG